FMPAAVRATIKPRAGGLATGSFDHPLGRRVEKMGAIQEETQFDPVIDLKTVAAADTGDKGVGAGVEIQVGFRTHRLRYLHHGFDDLGGIDLAEGEDVGDILRTNAENNIFIDISDSLA